MNFGKLSLIFYPAIPGKQNFEAIKWWKPLSAWEKDLEYFKKKMFKDLCLKKRVFDNEYIKRVKLAEKCGLSFVPITGHTKVPRTKQLIKCEGGYYEI